MGTNDFLNNSYKAITDTLVDSVNLIKGKTAIELDENIFHPAGGGQPKDHGKILIRDTFHSINDLVKQNGKLLVVLDTELPFSDELWGEEVHCEIDWQRRFHLMRFHTCAHVLMSSARQIVPGYQPKGMIIQDDISDCIIKFSSDKPIDGQVLAEIQQLARIAIGKNLEVTTQKYSSLEAAKSDNQEIFRVDPDMNLKGKIRVVIIQNFDANPCSGTHLASLGEIGDFQIQSSAYDDVKSETNIIFSVNII